MKGTLDTLEVLDAIRKRQRVQDERESRDESLSGFARTLVPATTAREAFDQAIDAVLALARRDEGSDE